MIDVSSLTIGEVAKVEEISGESITSIADESRPKARVMIGVAYVMKKRSDPKARVADIEALTLPEISALIEEMGEAGPKSQ